MEWEDKDKKIKVLTGDDCEITSKFLNKNKVILHMKRTLDDSEGNVFVRLKEGQEAHFLTSKKLLASKKVIGMTLNKFKEMDVELL